MESPSVLYEDKDFLAVYKPFGLLTHKTRTGGEEALTDWVLKLRPEIASVGDSPELRPGLVHRLDKDTSGIILFAKTQKSFEYLKKLFQDKKITKTYLALVLGIVKDKSGFIDKPIGLKSGTTKRTTFLKKVKMVKEAKTEYRVLNLLEFGNEKFSLLEVRPQTGRTHQIRVHLNSIGHPVIGDVLYGGSKNNLKNTRLLLHAKSLEFTNESGKRIMVESELPKDLELVLGELKPYHLDR